MNVIDRWIVEKFLPAESAYCERRFPIEGGGVLKFRGGDLMTKKERLSLESLLRRLEVLRARVCASLKEVA